METAYIALDFRIVVAAVFITASVAKLLRTGSGGNETRLLAAIGIRRPPVAKGVIRCLPIVEMGLGWGLISGWYPTWVLAAAAITLVGFSLGVATALRRGYQGACFCFGDSSNRLGIGNMVFNGILLVSCTLAAVLETSHLQEPLSILDVSLTDVITIVAMMLWLLAIRVLIGQVEAVSELLAD